MYVNILIKTCKLLKTFLYICKTKMKDMTKEEFVVKVFQRAPGTFIKTEARKAIQKNCEDLFISSVLKALNESPKLTDWYIQLLGEELYAELQKFKTEG